MADWRSEHRNDLKEVADKLKGRAGSIMVRGHALSNAEKAEMDACRKAAIAVENLAEKYFKQDKPVHIHCKQVLPVIPSGTGSREKAIILRKAIWPLNSRIQVFILPQNSTNSRVQIVQAAVAIWNTTLKGAIQLQFTDNQNNSHVRVDFENNDGHWSYAGTYCKQYPKNVKTLNLDPSSGNFHVGTALHELGHALGLMHEHANPFRAIVWNEQRVIDSLARPPNSWSPEETRRQILDAYRVEDVAVGQLQYDTKSIMHYQFEGSWIKKAETKANLLKLFGNAAKANDAWNDLFIEKTQLSEGDVQSIQQFYPLQRGPARLGTQPVTPSGERQQMFTFAPPKDGEYAIGTVGNSDTVLWLYEEGIENELAFNDDSSDKDNNALINHQLEAKKTYHIVLQVLNVTDSDNYSLEIKEVVPAKQP